MAYKREQGLSDAGQCIRYLLITGNVFFWMISCAVIGVGVWIIVENNYMSVIYGNVLMTVAAYLIVIAGGVMFLVTGCGCIGAIAQNRTLLLVYCVTLIGIALFFFVGAILAIVYRTEIKQEVQYTVMSGSIQKDYGVNFMEQPYNKITTWAWDTAQAELYCCGVEDQSWNVYRSSEWYKIQPGVPGGIDLSEKIMTTNTMLLRCCGVLDQGWGVYKTSEWYKIQPGEQDKDKPYVPLSCCKTDQYKEYINEQKCRHWNLGPPGKQGGDANEAIYYRGCYGAGRDFIMDFTAALIGIGIGVCCLVIAGIVFSFMLYRMVDY